ncbi:MAG: hypothetical protein PHD00_06640 [Bacteroidales bacterium]|nr:hypothetical protein [Bacteroidales bacterium]MDD4672297.1 hypothetical protein [Bacteroidales bacterium]MDY0347404.1 hypothetical protein [Tenuifilaceae bacterium]
MNIKNGNKIIINGKTYIKVKLRFVDTLDNNSTKILEQLEDEVESLTKQIEYQHKLIEKQNNKIESLELFNINLFRESAKKEKIYGREVDKLKERIESCSSDENEAIKTLKGEIKSLRLIIASSNKKMKIKNNKISELQLLNKEKDLKHRELIKTLKNLENNPSVSQCIIEVSESKEEIMRLLRVINAKHEMINSKNFRIMNLEEKLEEKRLEIKELAINLGKETLTS